MLFALSLSIFFISCGGNRTAIIWTDRPEFAFYSKFFNSSQNQHKVSVRYFSSPAEELQRLGRRRRGGDSNPDIIIGSWLKNEATRAHYRPLNNLFGRNRLSLGNFYPRLASVGRIGRNQYLLPVSFNIPALIFSRDTSEKLSSQFTVGFDEIKNLSRSYNVMSRGSYTHMGFSPLWSDDFLLLTAILFNASFREASSHGAPLIWDDIALNRAMDFVYNWTLEINTSNQATEDFAFKYFFEPSVNLIQSGRILFSYMQSAELFTLREDIRNNLDFRWIMEGNRIPITGDAVFLGIPKRGNARRAAEAFVLWFFNTDTQRQLLYASRAHRINESIFGISGGFSALSPVTELVFPQFYPGLLGRMPPSEHFMPPSILPSDWIVIRERVVFPFLHDRARSPADETIPLDRRLADWLRMNR